MAVISIANFGSQPVSTSTEQWRIDWSLRVLPPGPVHYTCREPPQQYKSCWDHCLLECFVWLSNTFNWWIYRQHRIPIDIQCKLFTLFLFIEIWNAKKAKKSFTDLNSLLITSLWTSLVTDWVTMKVKIPVCPASLSLRNRWSKAILVW